MTDKDKLNKIALDSERDLNTYQSKTGAGKDRDASFPDAGVIDTESKFKGSTVKVGNDFVSNASYNRRIPGDEGGDRDDKGRWLRGSAYEGSGGPEDKTAHVYQHNPGKIDEAIVKGWGKNPSELEKATISTEGVLPPDQAIGGRAREPLHHNETSEQGRRAAKSNIGMTSENHEDLPERGHKGSRYKGEFYENRESVPDQNADMNEVPSESITETSRNI